jgi:hypothetical protein
MFSENIEEFYLSFMRISLRSILVCKEKTVGEFELGLFFSTPVNQTKYVGEEHFTFGARDTPPRMINRICQVAKFTHSLGFKRLHPI